MGRRVLAWLFMVVVFVGSFAAPVYSSSQDDGRSVWAAGAGVVTAGNDGKVYGYRGGKIWNRRSLGTRLKLPPAPVSNKKKAAAMPGPPSPTRM
ncbi:hypothetical protein BDA96_10G075300 [Sorghum bicolor]|uniref:Phytocyanin domain-containing protein n=1 Tax=Sorghum bicolor TaxID=4558 RepID=A0A921PZX9_SORBI|nr:hypothetical protein BDA96_10G075300 [Sorghum bicolor]